MSNPLALRWLYRCPGLTLERWQEECRLVEERFSLFRPFAESPFFGFRGIVARSGREHHVTVAAEMDMYPKHAPWVFVTPTILERVMMGSYALMSGVPVLRLRM